MGGRLKEARRANKLCRSLLKDSCLERSRLPSCNNANTEADVGPSAFVFSGREQYGSMAPLAEPSSLELTITLIAAYKCYIYQRHVGNPNVRKISKTLITMSLESTVCHNHYNY